MEVESVEAVGAVVRCVAVTEKAPGLVASVEICRQESRLIVTQLCLGQDQHTDFGSASEVTSDHLRLFAPAAIIRALTDYLAAYPSGDLLAWFQASGSETVMANVVNAEAVQRITEAADPPRRAGRPAKFNRDEMVHWTTICLQLDADRPRSLHDAIAHEMRDSGRDHLAHSTRDNARDLLRTLREHGYLEPARKGGARDPLNPGPHYPFGVDPS